MAKTYYSILSKYTNKFDVARFNLIWRFNYVLTLLFFVFICFTLIQGIIDTILLFSFATLLTLGSLIFLYRTNNYKAIYIFISCMGILLPSVTINTDVNLVHYGDIVWIIVAISLAYFGLGSRIGKYFAIAGILSIAVHIIFYLNYNLSQIKPLNAIDKTVLILEITIALSIVFYIIYQYTQLYSESEKKLTAINQELEKQNNDKELLLKEIHHRVKNNLQIVSSLLSLQSNSIENEHALSAIKEGQSRIKSMALLHQKLYQNSEDFSKLDFNVYVTDLVQSINSTHANKERPVQIQIDISNIYFDIDTAVPLGLIINELCTNSYKYALNQGGSLFLTIQKVNSNEFKLTIKDTGKGLPLDVDIEKANSLGLKLINMLTKQLRGRIEYLYENGAKFIISFTDKTND